MKYYIHITSNLGDEAQDVVGILRDIYITWLKGSWISCQNGTTIVEVNTEKNILTENGIHQFVRFSPFDASNRRYTTFVDIYCSTEQAENPPSYHFEDRVRSYIINPYTRVVDHKKNIEIKDENSVINILNGDLDYFYAT